MPRLGLTFQDAPESTIRPGPRPRPQGKGDRAPYPVRKYMPRKALRQKAMPTYPTYPALPSRRKRKGEAEEAGPARAEGANPVSRRGQGGDMPTGVPGAFFFFWESGLASGSLGPLRPIWAS